MGPQGAGPERLPRNPPRGGPDGHPDPQGAGPEALAGPHGAGPERPGSTRRGLGLPPPPGTTVGLPGLPPDQKAPSSSGHPPGGRGSWAGLGALWGARHQSTCPATWSHAGHAGSPRGGRERGTLPRGAFTLHQSALGGQGRAHTHRGHPKSPHSRGSLREGEGRGAQTRPRPGGGRGRSYSKASRSGCGASESRLGGLRRSLRGEPWGEALPGDTSGPS